MKFATGIVLAALAVTAANAGNPNYLRSTKVDSVDDSGSDDFDFSSPDSLDASGSDDLLDDLMVDLTALFGSDSTDGSDYKMNIMSLIGSGSDQVDLDDILDAIAKEEGSDASDSGSDDDLSWLQDDSESGNDDPILVKGGNMGKTDLMTKGKTPEYDDSDSGSFDWSFLLHSDSDSGSDDDDVVVKGAAKSPATKASKSTKTGEEGNKIGNLYDDGSDGIIGDDSESDEDDPTLVKGAAKSPATKASKSTKTGEEGNKIGNLYDDGSDGIIGDDSESDEDDPTLVKGAAKGKTPVVEDDSESASDEDDQLQSEQEEEESPATKTATKSSKILP